MAGLRRHNPSQGTPQGTLLGLLTSDSVQEHRRIMMGASTTWMERLGTRVLRLPVWTITTCFLLFVGIPYLIAFLEGSLSTLIQSGEWRRLILQPVIVIYILVIAPPLFRSGREVIESFRGISKLNREEFDQLIDSASRIRPRSEVFAIAIGAAFGFLISNPEIVLTAPSTLRLYYLLANMVMYGMMSWIIFLSLAGNRTMAALHRQPLSINIFDIEPFEPVGRQSLMICLAFVGGTIISLLFVFSWEDFLTWQNLVVYGILTAVTILLFFVNMWRTHQALVKTKHTALTAARRNIDHAYRTAEQLTEERAELQAVSAEISTWTTIEQRLRLTRTWPYNTEMLRTLFISALMPLFVALIRLAGILLTR